MKKILLILMVTIFTGSVLLAQNRQRRSPEEMAKAQTENLTEKLGLNQVQKDSVYKIVFKSAQQMSQQRANSESGDRQQRREQFQKAQEQVNKDIRALLTEDQQKKYDALLKEMQNNRSGGNREGRQRNN